jgi:hypothetical protein
MIVCLTLAVCLFACRFLCVCVCRTVYFAGTVCLPALGYFSILSVLYTSISTVYIYLSLHYMFTCKCLLAFCPFLSVCLTFLVCLPWYICLPVQYMADGLPACLCLFVCKSVSSNLSLSTCTCLPVSVSLPDCLCQPALVFMCICISLPDFPPIYVCLSDCFCLLFCRLLLSVSLYMAVCLIGLCLNISVSCLLYFVVCQPVYVSSSDCHCLNISVSCLPSFSVCHTVLYMSVFLTGLCLNISVTCLSSFAVCHPIYDCSSDCLCLNIFVSCLSSCILYITVHLTVSCLKGPCHKIFDPRFFSSIDHP